MATRAKASKSAARRDALKDYEQKRDFTRTAEPKPASKPASKAASKPAGGKDAGWRFVVQKHDARRVHYDLRLELGGTLKSWAVTQGPEPDRRREAARGPHRGPSAAVSRLRGQHPQGRVWRRRDDRVGRRPLGAAPSIPTRGSPRATSSSRSTATRLKGRWHLVRMRPRPGEKNEQWLLIKAEDEFARQAGEPDITEEETTSHGERTHDRGARRGRRIAQGPRRPRRGERGAQDRRCPIRARCAARARESCRPSSSRACRKSRTSRRAAQSGCTRSSTTATACRRASTAARSSCSPARGSTGRRAFRTSMPR